MPQHASRYAPPPSRRPAISTSSRHSPSCAVAALPSHHRIAHPSCHPSQPSRTKIRRDGRTASGSRWPAGPATAAGGRGPRGSQRPATSSCGRGLPSPLEHAVKPFKSTRPGTSAHGSPAIDNKQATTVSDRYTRRRTYAGSGRASPQGMRSGLCALPGRWRQARDFSLSIW